MQSIGVASRDAFSDSSFSASSSKSGHEAFKGRLYGDGAWSPSDNNNVYDYLQIDLLYEFVICAVATQGKSTADHWTTKYKLQLSYDGSNWVIYQENNTDKVGLSYELRDSANYISLESPCAHYNIQMVKRITLGSLAFRLCHRDNVTCSAV